MEEKKEKTVIWEFNLCYEIDYGNDNGHYGEFKVYTNNEPDYYLSETIEQDIKGGWDGKNDPLRKWYTTDVRRVDQAMCTIDKEDIENFN